MMSRLAVMRGFQTPGYILALLSARSSIDIGVLFVPFVV